MVNKLCILDTKGKLMPRTPFKVFAYAMLKLSSARDSNTLESSMPEIVADLQEALIFGILEAALQLGYLYNAVIVNLNCKEALGYKEELGELYIAIYQKLTNQIPGTITSSNNSLAEKYVKAINDNKSTFFDSFQETDASLKEAVKLFKAADQDHVIKVLVNPVHIIYQLSNPIIKEENEEIPLIGSSEVRMEYTSGQSCCCSCTIS